MKLKKWMAIGILVFGVGIHLSFTSPNKEYSEIYLYNIETLSSGERNTECFGVGSVDCPRNSQKARAVSYQ